MRVVFPTDENMGYLSHRGAHFGKAKYYTIITLEEGKIADVESVENPGHSGGLAATRSKISWRLNPMRWWSAVSEARLQKGLPKQGWISILTRRVLP